MQRGLASNDAEAHVGLRYGLGPVNVDRHVVMLYFDKYFARHKLPVNCRLSAIKAEGRQFDRPRTQLRSRAKALVTGRMLLGSEYKDDLVAMNLVPIHRVGKVRSGSAGPTKYTRFGGDDDRERP